jgi:hypothetical protein
MQRFSRILTLTLIGALVCASIATSGVSRIAAQEDGLSGLGLPELNVSVSNTAFEGIPAELEAGRYLVTVSVSEEVEFGGGVAFVQPEGITPEEFLGALAGPAEVAGEAPGGTPELVDVATPAEGAGEEMGSAPPEFFYQFPFAGGIYAPAGQSDEVVLDLTPGEWVAWGDNPEAPQEPVIFTVTGEMPADLTEPESSATIIMAEYSIEVTEGELTAGQQVVKVTNVGAQPHFVFVALGPDEMTEEDIVAILEADMTGTPAATDINPDEDFVDVLGTGTQSTNTDIWVSVDLEPGKYVMVCFFPDIESGLPHALEGMYNVIEVSE